MWYHQLLAKIPKLFTRTCNKITLKQLNTYNAILSPNGRYLYDCFISMNQSNDYLIETDINIIDDLIKYLKNIN